MKIEEIRNAIAEAILKTYRDSLEGNAGNYYSAYITPQGEIYYGEEVDALTEPARVWEGIDREIVQFKCNGSPLPEGDQERAELLKDFESAEDAEEWIIDDLVSTFDSDLEENYGEKIDDIAEWIEKE